MMMGWSKVRCVFTKLRGWNCANRKFRMETAGKRLVGKLSLGDEPSFGWKGASQSTQFKIQIVWEQPMRWR